MLGRKVWVPEEIDRVVGLRAGALRLLAYLDVIDKVAGVEDIERELTRPYNLAYPELAKKPVIGPSMGGDAELILSADPDLIFMTYTTAEDADALQELTGIPVFALNIGNLTDRRDTLYRAIELAGRIMHRSGRADSLIKFFGGQIRQLDSIGQLATRRPEVYCGGISYRGSHGIVSTDPNFPPFHFTRARNVASGLEESLISPIMGTYIDLEQLLEWEPEYIFIDASGKSMVRQDIRNFGPVLKTLRAFKKDHIYQLFPHNWYATNYETVLVNAWHVAGIIYPGHVSTGPENKAALIYSYFLGSDVYESMSEVYGAPGKFIQE